MIYGYLIVQSARHSLNFCMARKTLSFSLFHSLLRRFFDYFYYLSSFNSLTTLVQFTSHSLVATSLVNFNPFLIKISKETFSTLQDGDSIFFSVWLHFIVVWPVETRIMKTLSDCKYETVH